MVVSFHCVLLRALFCDTKTDAPIIIIQKTHILPCISLEDVTKYHKNRPQKQGIHSYLPHKMKQLCFIYKYNNLDNHATYKHAAQDRID